MKRLLVFITTLAFAIAACGTSAPSPTVVLTALPATLLPMQTSAPVVIRIEPIIPADLGDRVTGPATAFVDAPRRGARRSVCPAGGRAVQRNAAGRADADRYR